MFPILALVLVAQAQEPTTAAQSNMNPDIALIADLAFALYSSDDPLEGSHHDPSAQGFNLQGLELTLGKAVDPYFRLDANLGFSMEGAEIEEVYGTTLALPGRFQIRAGQFLTRFGRHNPTHLHAWSFVDAPFAMARIFGAEGNRGLGAEASWLAPLPWSAELLVSSTMADDEETARSFAPEEGSVDLPLQTTAALKQFFSLNRDLGLSWGLSWATGPQTTAGRGEVWGSDVLLRFRPLAGGRQVSVNLEGEVFCRRRQIPDALLTDWSAFALLDGRFSKRWGAAARYEWGAPAMDADGHLAEDPLDFEWTATRQRGALALSWWPSEFSRLRLQGEADLPGWVDSPELAAFLAFELSAGAHGAHRY